MYINKKKNKREIMLPIMLPIVLPIDIAATLGHTKTTSKRAARATLSLYRQKAAALLSTIATCSDIALARVLSISLAVGGTAAIGFLVAW